MVRKSSVAPKAIAYLLFGMVLSVSARPQEKKAEPAKQEKAAPPQQHRVEQPKPQAQPQRAQPARPQAAPQRAEPARPQAQPQRAQQPAPKAQPQQRVQQAAPKAQPQQRVQQPAARAQPAQRAQQAAPRAQPQQRAQNYAPPQRSTQQAQAWQQKAGWRASGSWQGGATFQQARASNWSSQHRSWAQRGGYGGYIIPTASFGLYFGVGHWFRIGVQPFIVNGYPEFRYGGYTFMMVDPWPQDWSPNWYATDQLYIGYDNGYYLFDQNYPGEAVAIAVVM